MIKIFLRKLFKVCVFIFIIINFKQMKAYAKYIVNTKETIIQIENADNEKPIINRRKYDFYNESYTKNAVVTYSDNIKVKSAKYWFSLNEYDFWDEDSELGSGTDFESGTEFKDSGWYLVEVEDFYNNKSIYGFFIDKEVDSINFSATSANDTGSIFEVTATDKMIGVSEIDIFINDKLYKTYKYNEMFTQSYTEVLEVPIQDLPFYENCYAIAKDFFGHSIQSDVIIPNTSRIYTLKDLMKFRDMVNSNSKIFNGKDIYLINDLNMYEACHEGFNSWNPIGSKSQQFEGNFYGNGHTISNLYINSSINFAGLFGVNSGKISNLNLNGKIYGNSGENRGGIARKKLWNNRTL